MKVGLLVSLIVGIASLTAIVGCGSAPAKDATDIASDPSYQPPGQGDLAVGADPEVKAKKAPRARHLLEPNKADVQSGSLARR